MSADHGPHSAKDPKAIAGAALALALTAYGIFAKRRVRRQPMAQEKPLKRPSEIPKRDWWNILRRVKENISQKHLSFVAAGAAFYAFLAIPAGLAVLASLSLLIFDASSVQRGVQPVEHMVPPYVIKLLSDPHARQTLGIGLLVSLTIDLWSVLSGSSCMLTALRLVYGERSKPSFINRQVIVLVLAAITVPFALVSLALIVVLPAVIDVVPLSRLTKTTISVIRWPILIALFMTVLAAIYRYAPHRAVQRWQWTSWGATTAMVLWIAGSAVFSVYVREFLPYDQTYGALGTIMGLLAWLNFTAFTVLLGAQINAEIEQEHQSMWNTRMTRSMRQQTSSEHDARSAKPYNLRILSLQERSMHREP